MEKEPSNVKAFFRKGQAYLAKQNIEEAKLNFELALEQDPNNPQILEQLEQIRVN